MYNSDSTPEDVLFKDCLITHSLICFHRVPPSRIDHKVSSAPYGVKLHDEQAILNEVKSIRDAISSGEKEKQELMQVNRDGTTYI